MAAVFYHAVVYAFGEFVRIFYLPRYDVDNRDAVVRNEGVCGGGHFFAERAPSVHDRFDRRIDVYKRFDFFRLFVFRCDGLCRALVDDVRRTHDFAQSVCGDDRTRRRIDDVAETVACVFDRFKTRVEQFRIGYLPAARRIDDDKLIFLCRNALRIAVDRKDTFRIRRHHIGCGDFKIQSRIGADFGDASESRDDRLISLSDDIERAGREEKN